MANRYDEDRGWGGRHSSPRYRGSEERYEEDYDDTGGRIFGSDRYFGSGRQGYGEGYSGGYNPSGFGSRTRFGGESGGRRRRRRGGERRNEPRSSYRTSGGEYGDYYGTRGYGEGSERPSRGTSGREYGDYYRSRYTGSPYDRSRPQYGEGVYGGRYPESERGFMTDQEAYEGEERGWWDRTTDEIASWFGDEEAARRRQMDARHDYRGRGPRGYTRSDDRIKEDVNDDLTDSWSLDASDIQVDVSEGYVILTGTVNSRYEKRLAEDIAEDVSGVKNVENRVRVNTGYGQETTTPTTSTTSTTGTSDTSRSTTAGQG